ncbi:uncharacterized protein LOC114529477 [Dendronephthya gigantea]|uniref:uncharacterized protein LOC114529477 n=1 Tax=Dendronephthya gigantea TaxID=151771 RepID=UPI001069FBC1|nr:uncharacterized protein LOC114529477 [Dendronephthya gigantea]
MFRIRMITETSKYLKNYLLQTRVGAKRRPSFDEIDCHLACDPTALYAAELDGTPIGIACIFKYEDGYCHGGGTYIEKNHQKSGYGMEILRHVVKNSEPISNLTTYARTSKMPEMFKKYLGNVDFLFSAETHNINSETSVKKLQGNSSDASSYHVREVADASFESLVKYDKVIFGYDRKQFLHKWLYSPASHACVALNSEGSVAGYIVARESVVPNEGYKIGPLYCENISIANALLKPVLEQINKQGSSSSVHICCPIGKNPQVEELLKSLDSEYVYKHSFIATNGLPRGHHEHWFAITSTFSG